MPKLSCLCGETINLSLIPNPHGFKIVHEPSIEGIIDKLSEACQQATRPISREELQKKFYDLVLLSKPGLPQAYECPSCGRLVIFTRASDSNPSLWYQREQIKESQASSLAQVASRQKED